MDTNDRQDQRHPNPIEEQRGVIADAAPIIGPTIIAGGQIIAAKISKGKDKGDGKS